MYGRASKIVFQLLKLFAILLFRILLFFYQDNITFAFFVNFYVNWLNVYKSNLKKHIQCRAVAADLSLTWLPCFIFNDLESFLIFNLKPEIWVILLVEKNVSSTTFHFFWMIFLESECFLSILNVQITRFLFNEQLRTHVISKVFYNVRCF